MKTIATIGTWGWLLLVSGNLPSMAAEVGQEVNPVAGPVTVELDSGRRLTAQVDGRTDRTQLWLRWSHGSAHLLRPVAWDRIRQVQIGDEVLSGDELRRRVEASRPAVIPAVHDRLARQIILKGSGSKSTQQRAERPDSERQAGKVRSLAIDVRVANWDADVEVDGLIVDVYPLDASGRPVAVHGTLAVELIVQGKSMAALGQSFPRRGRWTERVRPGDFDSGDARYRLSFSAVGFRPEFDLKAAPYGAVYATLTVPGQGVYSATASMVRVRPYSAVRDALQGITGQRFFPQERTGRGRR